MKILRLAVLLFMGTCVQQCHGKVAVIQAVENPHMQGAEKAQDGNQCSSACVANCPQQGALDAAMILTDPVLTQPDTLMMIEHKEYMGVQVPIYHFKQSGRINPNQLPFRLVRTSLVDPTGLVVVPVDAQSANDSWFPHYKWDILVCNACDKMLHLGWRFTPKVAGTGDVFYALIVDYAEDKRRSGEAEATRDVLEHLQVGVRAPAWLVALATSALGTQLKST